MINCPPMKFHYVDKNFNEIGPTVRIEDEIPLKVELKSLPSYTLFKNGVKKYKDPNTGKWIEFTKDDALYYSVVNDDIKDYVFYDRKNPEEGKAYREFKGYKLLEVYPYKPGADNLDEIVNGNKYNDYFDINYKYGPGDGNFRPGMQRIDNTGYIAPTVDRKDDFLKNGSTPWYWKVLGREDYCYAESYEFYFVYDINPGEVTEVKEKFETQNEKYITKNEDGRTYNLTLTGQVKEESKQKLDIVFLVDVTKSRNLPFDFNDAQNRFDEKNYAAANNSRKAKIEENISTLVDSLSSNKNLDVQYALVGFGGSRHEAGHHTDMNIDTMKVEEGKLSIVDKPFDDLTYVGRFTSSAAELKERVKNLKENPYSKTGANYTAAMMGLHYVLTGDMYQDKIQTEKIDRSGDARKDAKKIVIMIADGDPTYSYINESEVYDDTIITTGKKKDSAGKEVSKYGKYTYFANYKAGYSYGNGLEFSRVALNQARGVLANINDYHAFYSIGVGNKENWKHLKELSELHGFDQRKIWDEILEDGKPKFKRAKSALLTGADSKVFDGSDPTKLAASFKELEKKLIPSDRPTQFSITDTLSENVDLVKNSTLEYGVYKMTDAVNGVKLSDKELIDLGNVSLEKIDEIGENGKPKFGVRLKPNNFSLPAGYEIRVTAKIEPSKIAYEKLARKEANENKGGKRTDLYSLYDYYLGPSNPNNPYTSINDYKISEDEFGLFTNQKAEFNYMWKGEGNSKKYPNPIIKVQGAEVKLIKQVEISGFTESDYLNNNDFSPMLKSVLKDITFVVYEVEPNSKREYFSFKPFKEGISENQAEEGFILAEDGKRQIKREKAKYDTNITLSNNEKYLRLEYTITGLDPKKKYEISEKISSNRYIHSSQKGKQEYWYVGKLRNHVEFNPVETKKIIIQNLYTSEKKDIQITKEVKNKFTGFKLHPDDNRDVFDLYLKVYHPVIEREQNGDPAPGQPKSLTKDELSKIKLDNPGVFLEDIEEVPADENVPEGTVEYALHFQLKNGESKKIKLYGNQSYKVLEKKPTGYELAKFATSDRLTPDSWGTPKKGTEIKDQKNEKIWFSSDRYDVLCPGNLKIVNTSTRIPAPTGLVRDISPYILSIFGFIAMAGAYFAINKKRREA